MSSSLVRNALYSVLHDDMYVESRRMKVIKAEIDKILSEAVVMDEKFVCLPLSCIGYKKTLIISCMPINSAAVRVGMWEKYHKLRSSTLVDVWDKFYEDMYMEMADRDILVSQMTNDKLFNDLLKFHCPTDTITERAEKKELYQH